MLTLFKYLKGNEWFQILVCLVLIVFQVGLELKIPDYMALMTNLVQSPGGNVKTIWFVGCLMLVCALGSLISAVIVGFLAARLAATFGRRLRGLLFHQIEGMAMSEREQFATASLITRTTNDVTQVQLLITMGLQLVFKAPLMAVWALTKIIGKGYVWSVATGVALMITLSTVLILMWLVVPKFKKMQGLMDDVTAVAREHLTGLRVVRAYNADVYQSNKFERVNQVLTGTELYTNRMLAIMMPMMSLVLSGLSLSIYWLGAYLLIKTEVVMKLTTFANMVVFSQYAVQVIMSFMMLILIFILVPRASVAAKRILAVLTVKPSILSGQVTKGKAGKRGEVCFKEVSFKYPGAAAAVLEDLSFTAKAGETIAFIGSTGSGKSTLINLIPRFFDVTKGSITIDGVNVKDYQQEVLLKKIGYVPQTAVIFAGSVAFNVAYGDSKKDLGLIRKALKVACAETFVQTMKGQEEALLSAKGTNLSGGQKQRLAIARAVYHQPEIYIFDDAFGALDYKTEKEVRNNLKAVTTGATIFIVAQRLSTIMDADQIIVLEAGKMVGQGTHQELLKGCPVYQEIARSQLSKEELGS